MIRLFVGLALPETHRRQLSMMSHAIEGARWVDPENLHITLRFLGEIDEDVAEDIANALDDVTADPFWLTLKGLGTFGNPPHAMWTGVEDDPKSALGALHASIESIVVRQGLEPEHRKYAPHVTLARFKKTVNMARLAQLMEGSGDLALDPFEVLGFTLFQSHLTPQGAHYKSVAEYDFA